jgi:hypothetical protein
MVMRRTTATVKSVTSIVVAICFPPVLALDELALVPSGLKGTRPVTSCYTVAFTPVW